MLLIYFCELLFFDIIVPFIARLLADDCAIVCRISIPPLCSRFWLVKRSSANSSLLYDSPYYSANHILLLVDKTQRYSRAKIKWVGDMTEKKVNVIYINNQILELGLLLTTSTCKISCLLPLLLVVIVVLLITLF